MPSGRAWLVWIAFASLGVCILVNPHGVVEMFTFLKGLLK